MNRLQHALNYAKTNRVRQWVYFIKCQQFVKVGIAYNPQTRLIQMQTGCPFKLEMLHCYPCEDALVAERMLHKKYGQHWERGEWFAMPESEIELLQRMELERVPIRQEVVPPKPRRLFRNDTFDAYGRRVRPWIVGGYWHVQALERIEACALPRSASLAGRPSVPMV